MQVTIQELVEWVDDEGGWFSFLAAHKPVGEDDVPMEIRAAWVDLVHAYDDMERAVDRLTERIRQVS